MIPNHPVKFSSGSYKRTEKSSFIKIVRIAEKRLHWKNIVTSHQEIDQAHVSQKIICKSRTQPWLIPSQLQTDHKKEL